MMNAMLRRNRKQSYDHTLHPHSAHHSCTFLICARWHMGCVVAWSAWQGELLVASAPIALHPSDRCDCDGILRLVEDERAILEVARYRSFPRTCFRTLR